MPSQEEIKNQQALLDAHRQTLWLYLRQLAMHGEPFIPPAVEHGIREARENIRTIKATLRSWGVRVDNHPDDEESSSELDHTPPPYRGAPSSGDYDMYAFSRGGCVARLLMIFGPLTAIAGFILWMGIGFNAIRVKGDSSMIVATWGPVAFGMMICGGLLYLGGRLAVYTGMSRKRSGGLGFTEKVIAVLLVLIVGVLAFISINRKSPDNFNENFNSNADYITWTYKLTGFSGSRWDVWKKYVQGRVSGITWEEFKEQIVIHNPQLATDGYVFKMEKEYLLPER